MRSGEARPDMLVRRQLLPYRQQYRRFEGPALLLLL